MITEQEVKKWIEQTKKKMDNTPENYIRCQGYYQGQLDVLEWVLIAIKK